MSNSTHFDGLIEPTLSLFGIDIQCKEHIPALNESQMLELLQSFYDISEDSDHNENAYDFTNKIKKRKKCCNKNIYIYNKNHFM